MYPSPDVSALILQCKTFQCASNGLRRGEDAKEGGAEKKGRRNRGDGSPAGKKRY